MLAALTFEDQSGNIEKERLMIKEIFAVAFLAIVAGTSLGCGSSGTGDDGEASGTLRSNCAGAGPAIGETLVSIEHDGRERAYRLYVPAGYRHDEGTPMVLNFHSTGGSAAGQATASGMDEVADARTVILVYPEGLHEVFDAGLRDFSSAPRDDVDFARAIVDDVANQACVDRRRVYSTGWSNGARMSYRIACEAADLVAAVAPVAGVLSLEPEDCLPSRPVSVIAFHGTADHVAPYDRAGGFSTMSVPAMFSLWAEKTGCTDVPTVTFQKDDVRCESYTACQKDAEVALCTIENGRHCWPGHPACIETIDAGEAMLDFLLRFQLP
jgi:polyhydroxybutyrate depolymerase